MANNVYNVTELVGTSPDGVDAAVTNAITEASKTLRNLDWFEVQSIRGHVEGDRIADWQVTSSWASGTRAEPGSGPRRHRCSRGAIVHCS
jgi:flavin-binding protein dodecin